MFRYIEIYKLVLRFNFLTFYSIAISDLETAFSKAV